MSEARSAASPRADQPLPLRPEKRVPRPKPPRSSAATTELPSFVRGEQGNIILRWRCETCGWEVEVETPGYAGTGYHHFPDGQTRCGPLAASRV